MPDWPSTTKWLSAEEQTLAAQRLAYDGVSGIFREFRKADRDVDREHARCRWTYRSRASFEDGFGRLANVDVCLALSVYASSIKYNADLLQDMLCTGAQTIQYFIPTLIANRKALYTH